VKLPSAGLSLDLDNHWSYLRTRGDPAWHNYPSYLSIVVPRVIQFLAERSLRITVFVVGQDAVRSENREMLAAIVAAGHEIGNHSHNHEPWLHRLTPDEVRGELLEAHTAIEAATGASPRGFRGPGFSLSDGTLAALVALGYLYDATTLPTFVGPLARAYYFRTAGISTEEKEQRAALFGDWQEVLRPIRPYRWRVGAGSLVEFPVTTIPIFRLPFHFSYLLYAAQRSDRLADAYLGTALRLCRLARVQPSLLLHPLDFLGPNEASGLEFFPGMATPADVKLRRLDRFLGAVRRRFELRPLGEQVAALGDDLPVRTPRFRR
jgi:peptidoglycan/xylan/chitin deacetylase (PgdA/CDA1 family)